MSCRPGTSVSGLFFRAAFPGDDSHAAAEDEALSFLLTLEQSGLQDVRTSAFFERVQETEQPEIIPPQFQFIDLPGGGFGLCRIADRTERCKDEPVLLRLPRQCGGLSVGLLRCGECSFQLLQPEPQMPFPAGIVMPGKTQDLAPVRFQAGQFLPCRRRI